MSLPENNFSHDIYILRSKERVKLGGDISQFQGYLNFSNVLSFHL